jgi:putative pyruvate formate lyase activating enzyme
MSLLLQARSTILGLQRPLPSRPSPTKPNALLLPRIPHRSLGIPPQYLLDDYTPRYQLLTSIEAAKKRSQAYAHLANCNLCPRRCGVNRYETTGMCLIGAERAKVNVIAPHRGEEPCIQGFHGSGSVFFSGCNLRCVFCQNHVRPLVLSLLLPTLVGGGWAEANGYTLCGRI